MVQKKPTGEKKLRDVAGATGGCCVDHSNMCNMCNMYSETKDTVDGGEILHQLVVYPCLSHDFVSFLPSQASMIYRSHHRTCELGQLESLRIALFGGKQPGKTTMRFVGFFRKTREPARDSSAFWFKLFSQRVKFQRIDFTQSWVLSQPGNISTGKHCRIPTAASEGSISDAKDQKGWNVQLDVGL